MFESFILNSANITVALPPRRKERLKQQGRAVLLKEMVFLHDLISFTGLTLAADPAVGLAPLRYKHLEILGNLELARNHGNCSSTIGHLDPHAKELIAWWFHNTDVQT